MELINQVNIDTGRTRKGVLQKGFTLLEMIIVILLLGILIGVVYPYYTAYVRAGNNATAVNAYVEYMTAQAAACAVNNVALTAAPTAAKVGQFLNNGNAITAASFTVSGTPPSFPAFNTATCDGTTVQTVMTWTNAGFGNGNALTCTSHGPSPGITAGYLIPTALGNDCVAT